MLAAMRKVITERLTVSIVGPGNLGSALALNLRRAGCDIEALVVRSRKKVPNETLELARRVKAKIVALGDRPLGSGLVWITVPDDAIATVAAQLASTQDWQGKTVFHSSGALTSEVLSALRAKGAKVASVHPGMTFVRQSIPRLEGVPFGVEGDPDAVRLAKKLVRDLGGSAFPIKTQNKVLYHAFGTFASPMMIALMTTLEQVGKAAGINPSDVGKMAGPLLRQTLNNYLKYGAAAAFSGPLVRGDVATVRRHLDALRRVPEAREVYLALVKMALKDLPVKERQQLSKLLASDSYRRDVNLMKGVVPLYKKFREHLALEKTKIAHLQVLGRLEDYLTKEFAFLILSESGDSVLPIMNVGKKQEGRRIDIALAEGDLSTKNSKPTIRGFIEVKYVRNRHRWGWNNAEDETGTAFNSLKEQLQRRTDVKQYADYEVNFRGSRQETYGLVFASYIRRKDDRSEESDFVQRVVRNAKKHGLKESSRKAPTLRKIYSNVPVTLLRAEFLVSLHVGLWRL